MIRNIARLGMPLSSGLVLGLLYYEVLPAWLVFAALIPFFVFLDKTDTWIMRGIGGFVAGVTYYLFVLHTLAFVSWFGFVESETVFMVAAHIILAVLAGLTYSIFAIAYAYKPDGWLSFAYVPALFVVIDSAKQLFSFGFSWGFLGYLFENMSQFMRGVTLAGVPGATFLIVFVNYVLLCALVAAFKKNIHRALECGVVAVSACALFVVGGWLVQEYVLTPLGSVRVAIMETKNQRGSMHLNVQPYVDLFAEARREGAEIILMPESLIDPERKKVSLEDMDAVIDQLAQEYRGTLIVGGFRKEDGVSYNSAFFWSNGTIESVYDKYYLVPFAERSPRFLSYVGPLGRHLYERGAKHQTIHAGGVTFGSLVCQEVNYPSAGVRPTRAGAQILVSGANDGFAKESPVLQVLSPGTNPWFERIEYRMARFRAVENGRYLMRSTKVGIAGIIDPYGSDVARLSSGEFGVEVRTIERMGGLTPYTRFGDVPLLGGCAVLVGALVRRRLFCGDRKCAF